MSVSRKRKFDSTIPAHIDQSALPTGCYWNRHRRHWYTNNGGPYTRLADETAQLSDLHRLMEAGNGINPDSFRYISAKYKQSPRYLVNITEKTRKSYARSESIILEFETLDGGLLGDASLDHWGKPLVNTLIEKLAVKNGPKAANDCAKYIRIVFRYAMNKGYWDKLNPAEDIYKAKERRRRRLIEKGVLPKLIEFAQERGQRGRRKGGCTPYIWCILVIGYDCRLRGIETIGLTDASLNEEGIEINRAKGSRSNIVAWNGNLRKSVAAAIERRQRIWDRKSYPVPVRPQDRYLFVNEHGHRLPKSTLDTAFNRFINLAIAEGVITEDQRFGMHDLKRKGTTDTVGTQADKQQATGHKSASMVEIYDHSKPLVKPVSD